MHFCTILILILVVNCQTDDASKLRNSSDSLHLQYVRNIIISKINNGTFRKCDISPENGRETLYEQKLIGLFPAATAQSLGITTADLSNTYVYSPCMSSFSLGNALGNYLTEVACAAESKVNLILGTLLWDFPSMPLEYKGENEASTTVINKEQTAHFNSSDIHDINFFNALPVTFQFSEFTGSNISIDDRRAISARVRETCKCGRNCWGHSNTPWLKHLDLIIGILRPAIEYHFAAHKSIATKGTVLDEHDLSSAPRHVFLPIVPDVLIQYRCGDNVPSKYYGFLKFKVLIDSVPADSKFIYVRSDSPYRAKVMGSHSFSAKCAPIIHELFATLKNKFPKATVIATMGGDPFLDYYRIYKAKVIICSVSTFCLWPAIASLGRVYYPSSVVVAAATNPILGSNFTWLPASSVIIDFQKNTPLSTILQRLKGH
jgi:hypothetical protein